ncbi:spermine oxidase-like [Lycorma delicatula]|uniref:spermine oxidase-like n=1 Tax=Lycorma delicatula TaxID=130591 RepID=UPI003F5179E3
MYSVDPSWKQPRVIIIGAGIAGLSAAQCLLQSGISNFLIIEATERPGGRIHSRWMGDCMTELGAMWIEGASISNLAFLLASQEGVITPPLQRSSTSRSTTFFSANGKAIEKTTANTVIRAFQDLVEKKATIASLTKKSNSLGEFIQDQLGKELGTMPSSYRRDAVRVIGSLYNTLRERFGQDPCLVRSKVMSEMQNLPGGRVRIPLGFGSILAPLLRVLPACSAVYCKPVTCILYSPDATKTRAIVVCSDDEEYSADYVIVTIPLGVLKTDHSRLFSPPLPKEKVAAIEKLGFGLVERVFVQYEKPFWIGEGRIGLGWSLRELKENLEDWTRTIGELVAVPGSKATIHGVVTGAAANEICDCTPEHMIPEMGDLLRRFTGDSSLPNPINVQRSNWSRDPYFNGAYTYLGITSNPAHLTDLAEPIPSEVPPEDTENKENKDKKKPKYSPVLLFAGEATSPLNFSTVHGARESGIREAQRIIRLTNFHKGPPVGRGPPICKPQKLKKKG